MLNDFVIRETDTTRLVFRPMLGTNPNDEDTAVKGVFLFQRKGMKDGWEDTETIPLSGLRPGEGYKLELKSDEILHLFKELNELHEVFYDSGIPYGKDQHVRLGDTKTRIAGLGASNVYPQDDVDDWVIETRSEFEALDPQARMAWCLHRLEAEMNNGGFHQFFSSSSGAYVGNTIAALKLIGADRTHELLTRAVQVCFPGGYPKQKDARDFAKHIADIDDVKTRIELLDEAFYEDVEPLQDMVHNHFAYHALGRQLSTDAFKRTCRDSLDFLISKYDFKEYEVSQDYTYCLTNDTVWFVMFGVNYGSNASLSLLPYPPNEITPNYSQGIHIGYLLEHRKSNPNSRFLYPGEYETLMQESIEFHRRFEEQYNQSEQIQYLGNALKERGQDLIDGDLSSLPNFAFVVEHYEQASELARAHMSQNPKGRRFIGVYSSYEKVRKAILTRGELRGFVDTAGNFCVSFEFLDSGHWRVGFNELRVDILQSESGGEGVRLIRVTHLPSGIVAERDNVALPMHPTIDSLKKEVAEMLRGRK